MWQHKPKQDPAARSVACCDLVNRGLAYWPGDGKTPNLIFNNQLDGHVVALNAETGEVYWKVENSDIKVGSTLTVAPYVVKDMVIIGSSGAELGVRGYTTAYDVKTGEHGVAQVRDRSRRGDRHRRRLQQGQPALRSEGPRHQQDLGRRRLEDRRRHELGLVRLRPRPRT